MYKTIWLYDTLELTLALTLERERQRRGLPLQHEQALVSLKLKKTIDAEVCWPVGVTIEGG